MAPRRGGILFVRLAVVRPFDEERRVAVMARDELVQSIQFDRGSAIRTLDGFELHRSGPDARRSIEFRIESGVVHVDQQQALVNRFKFVTSPVRPADNVEVFETLKIQVDDRGREFIVTVE